MDETDLPEPAVAARAADLLVRETLDLLDALADRASAAAGAPSSAS